MMDLRNREVVPGRYTDMLNVPSKIHPKIILTKKRRGMVEDFKKLHPKGLAGSGRPRSVAWTAELYHFMVQYDPKIQRADVKRWIKTHAWITECPQAQEVEEIVVTPLEAPPKEFNAFGRYLLTIILTILIIAIFFLLLAP